jgi:hypothetical protein
VPTSYPSNNRINPTKIRDFGIEGEREDHEYAAAEAVAAAEYYYIYLI